MVVVVVVVAAAAVVVVVLMLIRCDDKHERNDADETARLLHTTPSLFLLPVPMSGHGATFLLEKYHCSREVVDEPTTFQACERLAASPAGLGFRAVLVVQCFALTYYILP